MFWARVQAGCCMTCEICMHTASNRRCLRLWPPDPVIATDHEFELGCELKEILPHEARGYRVAACELLDTCLRPGSAAFGLLRRDKPRALQSGQIGRVAGMFLLDKGRHGGGDGIVAHHITQGLDKGTLAIAACAMKEKQHMFPG